MKTILVILLSFPMLAFANSATDEFEAALAEAGKGIPIKPQISSFGDPITTDFKEVFRKLPTEKKEKLAAQITPLLPRMAQEERDPSIRKSFGPTHGILILGEIGSDEQKAQAFRNLDIFGTSLSAACEALATCEGAEGVEILKQYAESQFAELAKDGSRTPEGRAHTKPDVNIYNVVIALAGAYHPGGPVAAEKLKNQLLDLAKVRMDATRLAAVEKDFAKDMERARHSRENLIREKRPDNKRNSKTGSIDTETSGTDSDDLSQSISSNTWFWPVLSIAIAFLSLACWKLIGWRRTQ